MMMELVDLYLRCLLAGIMLSSAFTHFMKRNEFHRSLLAYELLPPTLTWSASIVLPIIELMIGIWLVTGWAPLLAAISFGTLLGSYTLAIAINLFRGKELLDCGCGGIFKEEQLTKWTVVRNFTLLVMNFGLLWLQPFWLEVGSSSLYYPPSLAAIPVISAAILTLIAYRVHTELSGSQKELIRVKRLLESVDDQVQLKSKA